MSIGLEDDKLTRRQAIGWLLHSLIRKGAEAVAPIVTTLAVVATDKTELSRRQFLQVTYFHSFALLAFFQQGIPQGV